MQIRSILGTVGLALVLLTSAAALASGRTEINQALVDEAGGFPFVITQPGSYVLTSDLEVASDVSGIVVQANDVSIDLNGFRVAGSSSCSPVGCTVGNSHGISSGSGFTVGTRIRVRNGIVTGFSGTCVNLRTFAHVAEVSVESCGNIGVEAGTGSVILENSITSVGSEGLKLTNFATYAHNVVMATGLANANANAVAGGKASAGNLCHDESCSPRGTRRYYLTPTAIDGNQALGHCASGFHMADIIEIINPGALHYDPVLGNAVNTLPIYIFGWTRRGGTDCAGNGVTFALPGPPTKATPTYTNDAAGPTAPWFHRSELCTVERRVWCVED